jgi:hypothetical protein
MFNYKYVKQKRWFLSRIYYYFGYNVFRQLSFFVLYLNRYPSITSEIPMKKKVFFIHRVICLHRYFSFVFSLLIEMKMKQVSHCDYVSIWLYLWIWMNDHWSKTKKYEPDYCVLFGFIKVVSTINIFFKGYLYNIYIFIAKL